MEVKVLCDCGQKFKFDVEPVNGEMPFRVNCPSCGKDGTPAANAALSQSIPAAEPVGLAQVGGRLQINRASAGAPATLEAPPPAPPRPIAAPAVMRAQLKKSAGEFNIGLGILGAILGAGLGAGLMFGFYTLVGFRFPWMGVGIGALTGFGARLLYKGTDSVLGFIAGGISLVAVVGTLFLMYGEFPMISIISVIVSVSVAWRIAA
ncbi:MAG TPA: hypothetical protein VFE51_03635 [Verrucomicrobiae bacterium]|nr:hypothetical protein [Verrucomicrobiae bacterium]